MKKITTLFLLAIITTAVFATPDKKQLKIRLSAPGGFLDETNIYFDYGVSPLYTSNEDGPKVHNTIPNAPTLYSLSSDNTFCSTNGYSDLSSTEIIGLGLSADTSGVHTFIAPNISNFDSTTIILLEDRLTNTFTDLRTGGYQFSLTDGQVENSRFYLHITRAIKFTPVTAGCANDDGAVQLDQDNAVVWSSSVLYDSTGAMVNSYNEVSGPYSFNNLAEGDYEVVLTYGQYVTHKTLHVDGNYIRASIHPSTTNIAADQEIVFSSVANNATEYEWQMGDETIITGVTNPAYVYYQPGNFTVVLKCTNDAGCQYTDSVSISVSAATAIGNVAGNDVRRIWSAGNTLSVVLNEELKQGAELKVYNLLGQPVYNAPLAATTTVLSLNNQPTGYYIVALQNNKVKSTRKVFIGNN